MGLSPMDDLKRFIARDDLTVSQAMQRIDANSGGILFLVSETGALTGCITDGDVRRYLLAGGKMDALALNAANRAPKVAHSEKEARMLFHKRDYIVIPIIFKNGQTAGKKIFKLILADSDGYKMRNSQLIMRYMPLGIVVLSLILLAPLNLYIPLTICLIIFLVSFALSMSSPKKMSLHDFTARTIVVDFKTSIIFDNELEEEQYIFKEDNPDLVNEGIEVDECGEEPELRYEK